MNQTELIVLLFTIVLALGIAARFLRIAYPILLVLGGLLLGFQPWAPEYQLNHELVFLLFLPPLLYAAAFNTHWPAFREQIRAISLLAVGLVLFTMALVAVAAHAALGLDWPVAFLLGAIVSPPDAVAATAVTQRVKLPRIIVTILEGESLVNDASALVAYRFALAAVVTCTFNLGEATVQFFFMSLGGIVFGLAGAYLSTRLLKYLNAAKVMDTPLIIMFTLLTPYSVYLPAEHLHVSGVLAVVAAGLWVGHRSENIFDCDTHIQARAVWEMVEFLLNGAIFILIGFQLPGMLDALLDTSYTMAQLFGYAALMSGVVIVARLVWTFPGAYLPRYWDRVVWKSTAPMPSLSNVFIVGWTGMRGVVSLAAALALPTTISDGTPFPHRALIEFLTFGVIFATLVLQGLTLPLLIRWLGITENAESVPPDLDPESCEPGRTGPLL